MERNEVRPPVSHVVVYIPYMVAKIQPQLWHILKKYYRGFNVWKRQEEDEVVFRIILYVLLLLYHKNIYW